MRKFWLLSIPGAALACLAAASLSAQAPATTISGGYLTPPKVIADIMDAEPLPTVSLSPDRTVMLLAHRRSMPSIAEVAAPFLGLAGARVNPKTNGARVLGGTIALTLKDVATGSERKLDAAGDGLVRRIVLARQQEDRDHAHDRLEHPAARRRRRHRRGQAAPRRRRERTGGRLLVARRFERVALPSHS